MLAAKCYFYHARTYELTKQLETVRRYIHAIVYYALFNVYRTLYIHI